MSRINLSRGVSASLVVCGISSSPKSSKRATGSSLPSSWIFLYLGSRDNASATNIILDVPSLYCILKSNSESCSRILANLPELIFESSSCSRLRWSDITVNLIPARYALNFSSA